MATPVGYRALYQVTAKGVDTKSGKPVTNIYYYRSGPATGAPPAFDSPISGSSLDTFLTSFDGVYGPLVELLSVNYIQTADVCRQVTGWKYGSPQNNIIGVTSTLTGTAFTVAGTLPKTTPFFGNIAGMTGAAAASGIWTISPTSLNTFTTTANIVGDPWVSGGTVQEVGTSEAFTYGVLATKAVTNAGVISGEALPLFADVSGRRVGSTAGRNWQGRNSYAPIGESQQLNGKLTTTALANWNLSLPDLMGPLSNGGTTGDDRDNMYLYNASFKQALTRSTPFNTIGHIDWFTSLVSSVFAQPNMGSLTKRKPRLTATIS